MHTLALFLKTASALNYLSIYQYTECLLKRSLATALDLGMAMRLFIVFRFGSVEIFTTRLERSEIGKIPKSEEYNSGLYPLLNKTYIVPFSVAWTPAL